jgi:RNA polymerase sigma-70 factor (ECF subfamily)
MARMDARDEALAGRAAAGDSAAFAELYDRYERSAYNLCYRITGSREDAADATQETFLKMLERLPRLEGRELNFGAYVMTVARNASYDVLERRKRATPTDEIPDAVDHEVPERAALRDAHQEQIRVANQGLPPRQREVLALRELHDLSYGEVAQIMGMNQNSVAQLISRARINLRDGLRQTALGSVASASPQCDRALPLLAAHQDGGLEHPWLAEHLAACGPCRVRLEAMEEAAVAYRQWLLLVPALWLREETAAAHERVSARATPRGRRLLVAAGAAFALLAFVAAEGAESPTRAYAPAPTPTPEAAPVARAIATKPQAEPPRRAAAVVRRARRRHKAPPARDESPPRVAGESPRLVAAAHEPPTAAPGGPPAATPGRPRAATPDRPQARRVRPPRDPRPVPEPVVLADPPAAEQPAARDEPPPPPPPEPPCTGPNCPGTPPPPCPGTSAATPCPPPRPPTVTCRTCGLVAPTPSPPPKALTLSAKP